MAGRFQGSGGLPPVNGASVSTRVVLDHEDDDDAPFVMPIVALPAPARLAAVDDEDNEDDVQVLGEHTSAEAQQPRRSAASVPKSRPLSAAPPQQQADEQENADAPAEGEDGITIGHSHKTATALTRIPRRASHATTGSSPAKHESKDGEKHDDDEDEEEDDDDFTLNFKLQNGKRCELDANHAKLLYLISRYAKASNSAEEKEGWIRSVPLMVLIYEGVTAGVLDFDYAPCSMLVSHSGRTRRMWVNVSQEGRAAVDDMREWKLLNGLKLSTEDLLPVTAFQVSPFGQKLLKRIPKHVKQEVHKVLFPGSKEHKVITRHLIQVKFETVSTASKSFGMSQQVRVQDPESGDAVFFLESAAGYRVESSITDTEDVSYVSSPFIPDFLRAPPFRALTDYSHRAHECARGTDNIRDELSVEIELSHVRAMVGEWIPYGANQIVALNDRLGAKDRCQGGLFTAQVDKAPTDTDFQVPAGLTSVKILDFDLVRFINFEAEIMYPTTGDVVQVENFGMHLNVDGAIMYGLRIEAIQEWTAEKISVDHLSRLLVDVHQDSSRIMNDLLSPYQRALLDMVFSGDLMARNKYNLLFADAIMPLLPAEMYMDRTDRENELRQVLGDITDVFELSEDHRLLIGNAGALLAGPDLGQCERLMICFLSLLTRDLMVKTFFTRIQVLDDEFSKMRTLIELAADNPFAMPEARDKLQNASRTIIMLSELLGYIEESLEEQQFPTDLSTPLLAKLNTALKLQVHHRNVSLRVADMKKLLSGADSKVQILQMQIGSLDKATMQSVVKSIEDHTAGLVAASAAQQRSAASLGVMNLIFSGSFSFALIDRLSGGAFLGIDGVDDDKGLGWLTTGIKDGIIQYPFLWWWLNILWMALLGFSLRKLMAYLGNQALGAQSISKVVNRRVKMDKLREYLSLRKLDTSDADTDPNEFARKVAYPELEHDVWQGEAPSVALLIDVNNGVLLTAELWWNARTTKATSNSEMYERLEKLFERAEVWDTSVLNIRDL